MPILKAQDLEAIYPQVEFIYGVGIELFERVPL
jgi:hypothetical protein